MLTSTSHPPYPRATSASATVRHMVRRGLAALTTLLPLSFCIAPICARSAEPVPAAVVQALKGAGIPLGSVGIVVEETGRSGSPLVAMNAGEPFNPASVMKLMTTYAALEMLGPASTWTTTLSLAEAPRNGVVAGDIYLQGSGDPKLTLERFWLLLHQMRDRGVRQIDGDLVLDRSLFAPIADNGAAFDDQPMRPYNVRPDALLLNFKALHLTLAPAGERIAIFSEPKPENLDLINLVKPGTGACGDWKEGLRSDVVQHDLRYRLVLSGDGITPDGARLTLDTERGPLRLSGAGQWVGPRLRFRGDARADAGSEALLNNLLNLLGQRRGDVTLLAIG